MDTADPYNRSEWKGRLSIKIKLRSFKSSEYICEKGNGSYHGFGYSSLFSDPLELPTWSHRELL